MTILEKRDAIFGSLKAQFRTKVLSIRLVEPQFLLHGNSTPVDEFLLDLANDIVQGMLPNGTCEVCGRRCAGCAEETNGLDLDFCDDGEVILADLDLDEDVSR
jgi:hypothetical protein